MPRPASRWGRSSATTTTTASRISSSTGGAGPSCFTTTAAADSRGSTETAGLVGWANINAAIWLDFDRDGRLDIFLGGYYPERLNLWRLADTEDHAGELRVRQQRRPEVPLSESRRRTVRRGQRQGRSRLDTLVAGRGGGRSSRHRLPGPVHRKRLRRVGALRQRGRPLPRGRARHGRRLRAQERHERVGRRRAQSGQAVDLRVEHLRGRHPDPGQQSLGARSMPGTACPPTRTWRARWGSILAAGASARSSAISTTTASWICISSTATSPLPATRATGTITRKWRAAIKSSSAMPPNWPAMGARSLAGYQPKRVWINDGSGRFVEVAQMVGASDRYDGRSVALADFAGRGMLDVVVANQKGPLLLYRNDVVPGRQWIAFDLLGGCGADSKPGSCSNRSAIGAQFPYSGTVTSRCRRCRAVRGSARRINADCTSGWARQGKSTVW